MAGFNSRAREGRDDSTGWEPAQCICFNSRAREGRDAGGVRYKTVEIDVSTHAPAKGATVSQSKRKRKNMFQLTRPRRARQHTMSETPNTSNVSTHAPAKGAT